MGDGHLRGEGGGGRGERSRVSERIKRAPEINKLKKPLRVFFKRGDEGAEKDKGEGRALLNKALRAFFKGRGECPDMDRVIVVMCHGDHNGYGTRDMGGVGTSTPY